MIAKNGRALTIYSVRTGLGREVWWSTGRKAAIEWAEIRNRVGHEDERYGPLTVYKSSVIRDGR